MPVRQLDPELLLALFEQSLDGMSIIDARRRYLYVNPAACQLLARPREDLIGEDVLIHFPESEHEAVRRSVASILRGQAQRRTSVITRPGGERREVDTLRMPLLSDGEPVIASIFRDVTHIRRRGREASALADAAASVAGVGSLQVTLDTLANGIVDATSAVAAIVVSNDDTVTRGFRAAESVDLYPDMDFMEEAVLERIARPGLDAVGREPLLVVDDLRADLLADPRFAGVHRSLLKASWTTAIYLPLVFGGERVGTAIALYQPGFDRSAEEPFLRTIANHAAVAVGNARLLAAGQARAASDEREHLARELHDSVSQGLYGIGLGARTARNLLGSDPARAGDALDYVLSLAEAALAEMRMLISGLYPDALEREGLVAALRKHLHAAHARHGLEVSDELGEEPQLSAQARAALYRIGQEAMHNVIKHARASRLAVNLRDEPSRVTLEVSDDGTGFEIDFVAGDHFGLTSMRRRAEALGGEVIITSASGAGTQVVAVFPR